MRLSNPSMTFSSKHTLTFWLKLLYTPEHRKDRRGILRTQKRPPRVNSLESVNKDINKINHSIHQFGDNLAIVEGKLKIL